MGDDEPQPAALNLEGLEGNRLQTVLWFQAGELLRAMSERLAPAQVVNNYTKKVYTVFV